MHSLAMAMHDLGHHVTGSDDEIYEPSRSRLASKGLLPEKSGWHPDMIMNDFDMIVLGMHARKDNPELQKALEIGLPISSFPEFIYKMSRDKTRIVVAGSHGKTSTCGMIAHVLHQAGWQADRMIGAKIGDLEPVVLSAADTIVLEGDEYLSSALDPRPKFVHYRPQIAIITGIAWDHMNVFPTYASYVEPFRNFISSLGETDTLIYCQDDLELAKLVQEISPECRCIGYTAHAYEIENGIAVIKDETDQPFKLKIFGQHNLQNLEAARLATRCIGLSEKEFYPSIQSFTGASKRLQLLYQSDHVTAYLDFAHAPSKVSATVKAVRERHPEATIVACLELHTFSSLNPDFLPLYKDSLQAADEKIVYYSPHTLDIKKLPPLSDDQLSTHFNDPALQTATTKDELSELVQAIDKRKGMVLLWMSSGRFDGLDTAALSRAFD